MKELELVVSLFPGKGKEFKQSLQGLIKKLQDFSSRLIIKESNDACTFSISVQWETIEQMHQALISEEFMILRGAIHALSEKTIILLDDKQVGNHISKLPSIIQAKL
jgi:hypothetical protein